MTSLLKVVEWNVKFVMWKEYELIFKLVIFVLENLLA